MKGLETLLVLAVALGCASPDARLPAAAGRGGSTPAGPSAVEQADAQLISSAGMGPIRLSMTIGEAMRTLPAATFARISDGDGLALVQVTFGADTALTLYADEDDAEAPIDTSKRISRIETFSAAFHTVEGVRPGALVTEVEALFGKTREIVKSEIESREFIDFEKQPAFLTLRLDYTGLFAEGANRTKEYKAEARILSIAVSSMNR